MGGDQTMIYRGGGDLKAVRLDLPRVYPITPAKPDSEVLLRWLAELLDAGCSFLQFRRKGRSDSEQLRELDAVLKSANQYGAAVIVDDRCDLCMIGGAAGVHLGQDDLPPAEARALLGPAAIIGYSTHGLDQARAGMAEPVDYLALGPVFPTASKGNPDPIIPIAVQMGTVRLSTLPLVAIGGITPERAAGLWGRGFDSVAVIAAFELSPSATWRAFHDGKGAPPPA
jgi:thiamine-phosphate pyrophosphorylase